MRLQGAWNISGQLKDSPTETGFQKIQGWAVLTTDSLVGFKCTITHKKIKLGWARKGWNLCRKSRSTWKCGLECPNMTCEFSLRHSNYFTLVLFFFFFWLDGREKEWRKEGARRISGYFILIFFFLTLAFVWDLWTLDPVPFSFWEDQTSQKWPKRWP